MSLSPLVAFAVVSLNVGLIAAAQPPAAPPTLLAERGMLLGSDELTQSPTKDWRISKGKWEIADGTLSGAEVKAEAHAACLRHDIAFHDAVIQVSFQFRGARQASLSVNTTAGHLCRVAMSPNGFVVQKDDTDKEGPDKPVILDARKTLIPPNEWHTLVVELCGKEMLASVDGRAVAFGTHEKLNVDKANIGLIVAGDSASFKDLRIWAATPSKDWEAAKSRLRGSQGTVPPS